MFSYWGKKANKDVGKMSVEADERSDQRSEEPTQNVAMRNNPNAKALSPSSSEERMEEFQEFLRRVQVLQMSSMDANGDRDMIRSNAERNPLIEVGVEPSTLMELDEINASSAIEEEPIIRNRNSNTNRETRSNHSNSNANTNTSSTTNIRVTVGIDKDLEMILEMDPSIVDLGDIAVRETTDTRVVGLPPLTGG